jgi:hypothetical protein
MLPRDYGLDDLRRVADGNHQDDSGIGLVKLHQFRRQEMARDRLTRLDLETPRLSPVNSRMASVSANHP